MLHFCPIAGGTPCWGYPARHARDGHPRGPPSPAGRRPAGHAKAACALSWRLLSRLHRGATGEARPRGEQYGQMGPALRPLAGHPCHVAAAAYPGPPSVAWKRSVGILGCERMPAGSEPTNSFRRQTWRVKKTMASGSRCPSRRPSPPPRGWEVAPRRSAAGSRLEAARVVLGCSE